MKGLPDIHSQITFLYYHQIEPAASFYGEALGLELVEDQGWAKIYRISGSAFLGIVAGEKGFHTPQERNAVLVTLVVDDVPGWYDRLKRLGIKLLSEIKHSPEIGVQGFFFQDPGGYALEVQQFLKPRQQEIFGCADPES